MTAGFASVSADIFALFVNYGVRNVWNNSVCVCACGWTQKALMKIIRTLQQVSSAHILTAVLMSAPAGLAVSKIVYPEVREGKPTRAEEIDEEEKTTNKSQDS